jgi:PAS domain S-box-containing protein
MKPKDDGSKEATELRQDCAERKRAELRVSAFSKLGQKLSAAKTDREAAEIIVDIADQLLACDACFFSLYSAAEDKMRDVLSLDTLEGRRVVVDPTGQDSRPSPLARRVIAEGGQLILKEHPDQMMPGGVPFGDTARPSAAILAVPIRDGPQVIGVMSIQSYTVNAYTPEDLELLQALADYCGGAFERIRAQMAEREARAFLEKAQEVAHLGSWSCGFSSDEPLSWSSEIYRIFGVSETQFTGKVRDFFASVHPEDRQRVETLSRAAVERGLPYELDHRIVRPDGAVRWVHEKAEIIRDPERRPLRMVGVVQDITERVELEERLRQAQKMEAIGQLAGGIAHDFNNILAAMILHLGLLRANPNLDAQTQESLRELTLGAHRAATLTRQLLLFSRRSVLDVKVVDLNELVSNVLRMLGRLIGEHIILRFDRHDVLPPVKADPGMLEQVLLNLSLNARDAMPNGGSLTISIRPIQVDAERLKGKMDVQPGQFVCLSVADTGCGMEEATLKRLFEPFFTTKEVGKGTGLGLATVDGIIAQHRGWVEVESALGKGTTFRVFLPATTARRTQPAPAGGMVAIRGRETILLVEDEPSLRRVVGQVLRRLGYQVLEAANGQAAITVWRDHAANIDLLFSDMLMAEGPSGLDLAATLRQEKPNLKVIISSGYNMEMTAQDRPGTGDMIYLQKPYPIEIVSKIVRECLDGKCVFGVLD